MEPGRMSIKRNTPRLCLNFVESRTEQNSSSTFKWSESYEEEAWSLPAVCPSAAAGDLSMQRELEILMDLSPLWTAGLKSFESGTPLDLQGKVCTLIPLNLFDFDSLFISLLRLHSFTCSMARSLSSSPPSALLSLFFFFLKSCCLTRWKTHTQPVQYRWCRPKQFRLSSALISHSGQVLPPAFLWTLFDCKLVRGCTVRYFSLFLTTSAY